VPTRFLSAAEIERLERFPEEIDERSLARYFALGADDLRFVRRSTVRPGSSGSRCSSARCGGWGSFRMI
jgi:hypothetical protein